MGLFDTIHCEYPLPDVRHQDLEFQTKDLERFLDDYTKHHVLPSPGLGARDLQHLVVDIDGRHRHSGTRQNLSPVSSTAGDLQALCRFGDIGGGGEPGLFGCFLVD